MYRLRATAEQQKSADDPISKPLSYYDVYEQTLSDIGMTPRTILEIGVFKGESTKVLATCFPEAKIVALDLHIYDLDFSAFPNVSYLRCDQTDRAHLQQICQQHFPNGIDLVIEDAAHVGIFAKMTMEAVFPFVRSGGLYVIEDWGTGYWDDWHDGGRYQEYPMGGFDGKVPLRMPSHDFGMVGFVKSLVDMVHEEAIKVNLADAPKRVSRLQWLRYYEGVCIACKK